MCTEPSNERPSIRSSRAGAVRRSSRSRGCLTERELEAYLAARETVRRLKQAAMNGTTPRPLN